MNFTFPQKSVTLSEEARWLINNRRALIVILPNHVMNNFRNHILASRTCMLTQSCDCSSTAQNVSWLWFNPVIRSFYIYDMASLWILLCLNNYFSSFWREKREGKWEINTFVAPVIRKPFYFFIWCLLDFQNTTQVLYLCKFVSLFWFGFYIIFWTT